MQVEFGNGRVISVSRQPLKGGGWVSLHEDVTERRRQEEKITHLARHDPLTGLANRVLFREQLEQNLQRLTRGQGFAVLGLDLDHFKAVNDTLGHPIGDALLKQVSQRLLACVRHGDLVARLGGDEFAIIQAGVRDASRTEALAARIVETIGAPFEIDGNPIEIGTSVGITLAPRDGADADKLLKNADLALYRAKNAGRSRLRIFRAGDGPADPAPPQPRGGFAQRAGGGGAGPRLPANRLSEVRAGDGVRGADALGPPQARAHTARGIHHHRRGDGPDRGDRRVGHALRLRSGGPLARSHQGFHQRFGHCNS